jgi:urease accessory protein
VSAATAQSGHAAGHAAGWAARLELRYRRVGGRTVGHDRHEGPLRVLKPLHPEGPAVCHHVLVHPPGGVVAGDRLDIDVAVGEGAHALLTTPGATRFYRSDGRVAAQRACLVVAEGARLEWLPLETIAYPGCDAVNEVRFDLEPGAEMIGWDLLALGLPAAGAPFATGRFAQLLHWPGHWLERGTLRADDAALLDGPLGLAGRRVLGTLWWAAALPAGGSVPPARIEALLDAARSHLAPAGGATAVVAGATAPGPGLVVLRALGPGVEPVMALLRAVRADWRRLAWALAPHPPRVWQT